MGKTPKAFAYNHLPVPPFSRMREKGLGGEGCKFLLQSYVHKRRSILPL